MTRRPSLGRALALAGAGIAAAAVIAGFIVIGGPGDARNTRLDGMTDNRVWNVLNITQCAFNGTGIAPDTIENASTTEGWRTGPDEKVLCAYGSRERLVQAGTTPRRPGDITYLALGPAKVRVCAFYRRPDHAHECAGCYKEHTYDSFFAARPAGAHCYDIDMIPQPTLDNYPERVDDQFSIMH